MCVSRIHAGHMPTRADQYSDSSPCFLLTYRIRYARTRRRSRDTSTSPLRPSPPPGTSTRRRSPPAAGTTTNRTRRPAGPVRRAHSASSSPRNSNQNPSRTPPPAHRCDYDPRGRPPALAVSVFAFAFASVIVQPPHPVNIHHE